MLSISDLAVDIQGSRILNGLSLAMGKGEFVCLLGRNGAGKTTTLRTVMGYRKPARGTISLDGVDVTGWRPWQMARHGVGFSPEESEIFADLTVAENIELPLHTRPNTSRTAESRIAMAYDVFPKLVRYKTRGGSELSGGERKMVSIARALALDPDLLLLDEPFEGLSPTIIPLISDGISSIRSMGRSIFMTESSLDHVPPNIDRLHVIERGEIIFSGVLADALRNATVARVIGGEL